MVYEIVFKKRFRNKLEQLFLYIEKEFGFRVAEKFAFRLTQKFDTLQKQPFIGRQSSMMPNIRSIPAGRQNRIYYRLEKNKIVVLNMYSNRIHPAKNKLE